MKLVGVRAYRAFGVAAAVLVSLAGDVVRAPSNFRRDVQQDRPPREINFAERQRQNLFRRDRPCLSADSLCPAGTV